MQQSRRFLCSLFLATGVLGVAGAALAQPEMAPASAQLAPWLVVTPPTGWERADAQEAGEMCALYVTTASAEQKDSLSVLACTMTLRDDDCKQLQGEAAEGTAVRVGNAVYENRSDTVQMVCAPTRDGKAEALFAVMADDVFHKHKAREMLAAFTEVNLPTEELAPGPDLRAYLPQPVAGDRAGERLGHQAPPLWGGLQYDFRNTETNTWEAKAVLMPWFPRWTNLPQVLRSLAAIIGPMSPEGVFWKQAGNASHPTYLLTLSHDARVLLFIRCADEATASTYQAAFDKFAW